MPTSSDADSEQSIRTEHLRAKLAARLFDAPAAAVMIGRFRVLDELGAGGMGRVFAAYDAKLDRKVAIKVVHGKISSEGATARLRREAIALGRLAHPNVVTVHEVGEHDGQTFVAMELVAGENLRTWRGSAPRSTREILAVYLQAARGLAAAHEAGVLHRDFKPDNAIVGTDGRVRVVDFGLARGVEEVLDDAPAERGNTAEEDELRTPLTATGSLVGTPSYMAPEQFRREPTDARTDQFSFCVALWESLYEQRPFTGKTLAELATHLIAGERVAAPREVAVPVAILRALDRGLAVDPADRYSDMAALILLIERELAPRVARRWIAGAVLASAAAVTAIVLLARDRGALESCPPAQTRLAGVWDDEVRTRLAAKYGGSSERPYVAASAASFSRAMDSLAAGWSGAYEQACTASRSTVESERRLAVQRLECLDSAIATLSVFVESASVSEPDAFARTYSGDFGIRDVLTCGNDAIVRSLPALPSDSALAREVNEVRRDARRAFASMGGGELATGLALAEDVSTRAHALDYAPLHAETLSLLGLVKLNLQHPDAKSVLTEAVHAGEAAGHDLAVMDALQGLVRIDDGSPELLDRMDALVRRLGDPVDARAMAKLLRVVATRARGDVDGARSIARELAATLGEDEALPAPRRAAMYAVHAEFLDRPGEGAAQIVAAERAVALIEAELGPGHPLSGPPLLSIAAGLSDTGDFDAAVERFDRLHAMFADIHPQGHPLLAFIHLHHGRALAGLGRMHEARTHWQRAEELLTRLLGADHEMTVGGPRMWLVRLALLEGDVDRARKAAEPLRAITGGHPGILLLIALIDALDGRTTEAAAAIPVVLAALERMPEHHRAEVMLGAAYLELLTGDMVAAREHAEAAVLLPRPHGFGAGPTPALAGWLRVLAGEHASALPLLEEAVREAEKVRAPDIAYYSPIAHLGLAVALDATGGDRDRAVRSATIAVEHAKQTGLPGMGVREKAAEWSAARAR